MEQAIFFAIFYSLSSGETQNQDTFLKVAFIWKV